MGSEVTFRNCLVAMRPKSTMEDLPSRDTVKTGIHNAFVDTMNAVKTDIEVT